MSSSYVWVQLYHKGRDKPEGRPISVKKPKDVEESEWNVDALIKAVKMELELDARLNLIFVYPPETKPPFSETNSIRPDKKLADLIKEFEKEKTPPTSYDHPLIVVAPAPENGETYKFNDPIQDQPKNKLVVAGPIAVAGPPAAIAPLSTPKSRDISNQIAAVFEGEVNLYLEDYFQSVLPGCNFSRFKSREICEDNTALEMDSFSYMTHDTLESPQTNSALGIYVVQPTGMNKKKPNGAPRKLDNSPGAKAANRGKQAEKYVVGESYSGDREDRMKKKVHELERKLDKMNQRHSSQSHAVSDATTLFGAAILSFTCQSLPRKDQCRKSMKAVLEQLSCTHTPILWRLAQAERFFMVVLSTREGANTCALREITRGIQGVEIGIQAILERLDEKAGEAGNEEIVVAEHQY